MLLKVIYKGEKYYRHRGTWVDESYIAATKGIQRALNQCYKDQHLNDLSALSDEQILLEAKCFKSNESPELALDLLLYLYNKHSFINVVPSMVTSCYRMIGNSEAAISFYEEVLSIYGYSMTL